MKLNEQQMASLSSPKAVREYLENQKVNITNIIKQNLAVGDIFKRENLQVEKFPLEDCVLRVEGVKDKKRKKERNSISPFLDGKHFSPLLSKMSVG